RFGERRDGWLGHGGTCGVDVELPPYPIGHGHKHSVGLGWLLPWKTVKSTMLEEGLLADLVTELPNAIRLQRLVQTLRERFQCGAVGLLRLDEGALRPVAAVGLVHEALGRRFEVASHPRLAAILASREPTWFEPDSRLPDPYDGLLDAHVGEPLPVHDFMGVSLFVDGRLWGAVTLGALHGGTFDDESRGQQQPYSLLVE